MHTVRPRRLGVRGPATVLLAATTALALTACGNDDDPEAGSTSTSSPSATTTSENPDDTASETTSAPTSEEPTETSEPPPEVDPTRPAKVRIDVVAGVAEGAPDRLPVAPGQMVRIVILSDVADELHVHGIEQTLALPAGEKQRLEFVIPTDTAPGLYEVELHTTTLLLFQLEVQ